MKSGKGIFFTLAVLMSSQLAGQNFTLLDLPIPKLANAKAEWADFNNDEHLDLFVTGMTDAGTWHTAVYINNGNANFNLISLVALADAAVDFGDFDRDGWIDIISTGVNGSGTKRTIIYRNVSGTAFVQQSFNLTPLSKGGIVWDDLDSDGDLDILLSGLDANHSEKTILYRFENNAYVEVTGFSFPQVSNGQLVSFDANNDGRKEILITGLKSDGSPISIIYTLDKNLLPSIYDDTVDGTAFNAISVQDYNSDGFADLVISGLAGDGLIKRTSLLRNNGSNGFVKMGAGLKDVVSSSVHLGDLDHDGLSDMVLSGIDNDGIKHFKYYRNSPSFTFAEVPTLIKNIYNGTVVLGDYESDGDLDLFEVGNSDINFQANLYISDQLETIANASPSVPTNLSAVAKGDSVLLFWNKVNDDHTAANSLGYSIYVSKNPGGQDLVVAPPANLVSGKTKRVNTGNAGFVNTKKIHRLPEGRYYWSAQAIDNSYRGSAFSQESSFAICYPISLGNDKILCDKDQLHLEMGSANDVVNWYSKTNGLLKANSNSFEKTMHVTDTIIVQLIKPYNCEVRDTLVVSVKPLPSYNLGNDISICKGQTYSNSITGNFTTVDWYNPKGLLKANSNQYDYKVFAKDTVIARLTSAYGCVGYDSVIVDVLPLPQVELGATREICKKENTTFDLTGAPGQVSWASTQHGLLATNTPTLSYQVLQKDTIIAEVTDGNQCVNRDSVVVQPLSLPAINLGPDLHVCYNEFVQPGITGNWNEVRWFTPRQLLSGNSNSYLWRALQKDTLIVEVKDGRSCINRDSVNINVLLLPKFSIGRDTAICFQKRILIKTGSGFQRVDWYIQSTGQLIKENNWFIDYQGPQTETLIAKVMSNDGCINYDSAEIKVNPLPVFSLGADRRVCDQDTTKFVVSGAWSKVNWFTDNALLLQHNNPRYQFKVDQDIRLWAEVFSDKGCVQYDTIKITRLPLPVFDLGDDRSFCYNDQISLDPGKVGTNYQWTSTQKGMVSTGQEYKFKGETSDRIALLVKDANQCAYRDTLQVKINPLPEFKISGADEICAGDSLRLTMNHNHWKSIAWYRVTADTLLKNKASLHLSLHQSTTFYARLRDDNSCVATQSHTVVVNPRPQAKAGQDTLLCFGESVVLGDASMATNDLTFKWAPTDYLDQATIAHPKSKPIKPVTYVLTVTSAKECSSTDSVHVDVNPEIVIDAGADKKICIGESIALGGSPTAQGSRFDFSYQWLSDTEKVTTSTSSNPLIKPTATSTYYVLVSSWRCEVQMDSVTITVNPLPQIQVSPRQSIGAGEARSLSASGGISYHWAPDNSLDDEHSPTPTASPLKSTAYTVLVTDENNCTSQGEVEVLVQNSLFIPSLFTPNSDGSNDTFKLYGSGIEQIELSVFDKNGNRVFHTRLLEEAFSTGWDGSSAGSSLADDTYTWTIEGNYYNGERVTYNGATGGLVRLMR